MTGRVRIAIRSLLSRADASRRCANCSHFDNRPAAVAAALPGLASFGSADSAVRSTDGVCARTARYLSSERSCEHHAARAA